MLPGDATPGCASDARCPPEDSRTYQRRTGSAGKRHRPKTAPPASRAVSPQRGEILERPRYLLLGFGVFVLDKVVLHSVFVRRAQDPGNIDHPLAENDAGVVRRVAGRLADLRSFADVLQ